MRVYMPDKRLKLKIFGHWGAYPGAGEATSCYQISAEGFNLFLDLGSGALTLLQNEISTREIDALIISHYHSDHIADVGCLQYAVRIDTELGLNSSVLPIYGHGEDPYFEKLSHKNFTAAVLYGADSVLSIGPFTVTFCRTVHPDCCYAVRVAYGEKSIVYTADTEYFDGLAEFSRGTDLLLCESSLYEGYRRAVPGHMSSGEAAELAEKGGVKSLVLTHLPHFGEHGLLLEQARAVFKGPIQLAESGLSLLI